MADVEHSAITGTQGIHETKQIAAAGVTSSDAGKVITPDGTNTAELRKLDGDELTSTGASANDVIKSDGSAGTAWGTLVSSDVSTTGAAAGEVYVADGSNSGSWTATGGTVYGEMIIANNASTLSLSAAGDSTLNTDNQYVKVDNGLWATGPTNGVTFNASGYLTIVTAGVYELAWWASFSIDTLNTYSAFKYSIDDTNGTLGSRKSSRLAGTADDVGAAAASAFITLSAGAQVSLWAAADKAVAVTILDSGLSLTLMKAS